MRRPPSALLPREWLARGLIAVAAAVVTNLSLVVLEIDHDAALVTLLAATAVAVGSLVLEAIDPHPGAPWTATRPDAQPDPGEDTRTAMFRHLIESHRTAREADDAVLWQIADLGNRRLRQVHGFRCSEDPQRAEALLGPLVAGLVSRDRRHRYEPGRRHPRYSLDQLNEAMRRIEEL